MCSAKAAAHAAERSASVRWPPSKENVISNLRLPALSTQNRLGSNPKQPSFPPKKWYFSAREAKSQIQMQRVGLALQLLWQKLFTPQGIYEQLPQMQARGD